MAEFTTAYFVRLDGIGAKRIGTRLQLLQRTASTAAVLLCFEDLVKSWCHRRVFAAWAESRLGLVVPEWAAPELG